MDLSHSDGDPAFDGPVRAFFNISLSISPLASSMHGAVRAPVPDETGRRQSPPA